MGVLFINSSDSIDNVKDKLYTMQILAQNNIPHPKTMLVKNPIDSEYVGKNIGFPIVVKSLSGTHGKGVYLAENKRNFEQLVEMMIISSLFLLKFFSSFVVKFISIFFYFIPFIFVIFFFFFSFIGNN